MLHKLGNSKSLSLAQNYLILSMPLGRSFVFRSFLQTVGLLRVHLYCSGRVLHSHHVYSRCSGPALKHSHRTHPRYSVPVWMLDSHHEYPRYSAPVRMPPFVCHDHHRPTLELITRHILVVRSFERPACSNICAPKRICS